MGEISSEIKVLSSLDSHNLAAYSKISGFVKLTKFRLSFLVVLSAVISYFTLSKDFDFARLGALILGGFMVTGAANGFNQIIEKRRDALMTRTAGRPLPQHILNNKEALLFCAFFALIGIGTLSFFINWLAGILGAISVLLYTLAYTPLKSKTPFSVFVGAFPGAIPTLIGAVSAGSGNFTFPAWLLFGVQFIWQFPHFWAIAWVSHDDYRKAGFFMLPSPLGRDKSSAFQIVIYSIFLIPVSLLPMMFGVSNLISGLFVAIFGVLFLLQAVRLYILSDIASARRLMFGSFFYLPLTQLCIMFGTIWK